jgi:hypothetical protein
MKNLGGNFLVFVVNANPEPPRENHAFGKKTS